MDCILLYLLMLFFHYLQVYFAVKNTNETKLSSIFSLRFLPATSSRYTFLLHNIEFVVIKKKKRKKREKEKAKQSTTAQWKWLSIHQECRRNMSCYSCLEPCPTFWLLGSLCSTSFRGNRSHGHHKYKNRFLLRNISPRFIFSSPLNTAVRFGMVHICPTVRPEER